MVVCLLGSSNPKGKVRTLLYISLFFLRLLRWITHFFSVQWNSRSYTHWNDMASISPSLCTKHLRLMSSLPTLLNMLITVHIRSARDEVKLVLFPDDDWFRWWTLHWTVAQYTSFLCITTLRVIPARWEAHWIVAMSQTFATNQACYKPFIEARMKIQGRTLRHFIGHLRSTN